LCIIAVHLCIALQQQHIPLVNLEIASLIELAASSAGCCSAVDSSSFDATALAFSTTSAAACLVVALAVVGAGASLFAVAGFAGGLTAGFAAAFAGAAGCARAATLGRSVCEESSDDSSLGIMEAHMRMLLLHWFLLYQMTSSEAHAGSNACPNSKFTVNLLRTVYVHESRRRS
jgi:hypothetical protein